MSIQLRDGSRVEDQRLDRLVQFDERSRGFAAVDLVGDRSPRSYTWRVGAWLDQGREGACVGFSIAHEAIARPKRVQGVTDATAREVYKQAQFLDPWPGTDYEGTSVLAGMKAGQERGWFGEYRWCFSEEDLAVTVGYLGPVVLGIDWHQGMFRPDANGFIHPTGSVMGGHAILCYSFSVKGGFYRLHNSWGPTWGHVGTALVSREDMALLISRGGEAAVPVGRAVPR